MRPSSNMENKALSDTNWKVKLGNMILQAHSSLQLSKIVNIFGTSSAF